MVGSGTAQIAQFVMVRVLSAANEQVRPHSTSNTGEADVSYCSGIKSGRLCGHFAELYDQLSAYEELPDSLYYTTRFIDGLKPGVRMSVALQ